MIEGRILLTGATGFLGPALLTALRGTSMPLLLAGRRRPIGGSAMADAQWASIDELDGRTQWAQHLEGVQVVVHSAGLAHAPNLSRGRADAAFRTVNVDATRRLAVEAVAAGVKRFVFISSIKVNGDSTVRGRPFRESDAPGPVGPYAQSKLEAERAIADAASGTGMSWTVIRPPLVHGPGCKGNLAALLRAVERGLPLPFAAIDNRRSFVGAANLADLVARCATQAEAANRVFLVRDDEDVSTPDLVRHMAAAIGRPARLFSVPAWLLQAAGRCTGRGEQVQRLCGDLVVDDGHVRRVLGWRPRLSLADGMAQMAKGQSE